MTQSAETLTQLVADRVSQMGMTWRQLSDRAIDPETGYRPNKDTLWKIANNVLVKISPELVRAIAAGLNVSPDRAQRAAAYQYTGYMAVKLGEGEVIQDPGTPDSDLPQSQAILDRWEEEHEEDQQHGASEPDAPYGR